MTERCIDASVLVKLAFEGEPDREKALALVQQCADEGVQLIAPALILAEADSAVRKRVFLGLLSSEEAKKAYVILDAAPLVIVDPPGLRDRARSIAEEFNQRLVYDSIYAAVADLRQCEFWTADVEFHHDVHSTLTNVKLLSKYVLNS